MSRRYAERAVQAGVRRLRLGHQQGQLHGDNCTLVMHDPRNGDWIAALNHGHFGVKMHRSRDSGATWSEIATPKYPQKPADYVPKVPVERKPPAWPLKLLWPSTPRAPPPHALPARPPPPA